MGGPDKPRARGGEEDLATVFPFFPDNEKGRDRLRNYQDREKRNAAFHMAKKRIEDSLQGVGPIIFDNQSLGPETQAKATLTLLEKMIVHSDCLRVIIESSSEGVVFSSSVIGMNITKEAGKETMIPNTAYMHLDTLATIMDVDLPPDWPYVSEDIQIQLMGSLARATNVPFSLQVTGQDSPIDVPVPEKKSI